MDVGLPDGFHVLVIQEVFDEVSPTKFGQNQSCTPTDSNKQKSVRGKRKSISGVKVVDRTIPLTDPSFDVLASLLGSQQHGIPEGEVRSDCS